MPTVLLLRHGRTTSNASGVLAGRSEVGLDEVGTTQAQAVGRRLRGLPVRAAVSSPLNRCRSTIELALPEIQATIEPALVECGYGDWEGQPLKQLARQPLWQVVQQHPGAARFPGPDGESLAHMSARAVAAVRTWNARVSDEHGDGSLWLACSHADVIKAIVADALGMHVDLFQRLVIDPGSITVIHYTPLRPFLVRLNDAEAPLNSLIPNRRSRRRGRSAASSDAVVGGGAGGGAGSVSTVAGG